ncbi:MAG TPA: cytochrome P460 family protein [Pyrinomonadaceae bacterium]|nr:cytochrome P460 family protein [Pyrinomonadaceae bacterium]
MIKKERRMLPAFTVATILLIGLAINYPALRSVLSRELASGSDAPDAVKAIAGYRSWTKVNPKPEVMNAQTAGLCGISLSPSGANIFGGTNPHHRKYITVYVNESGRKAMMEQASPKFPQGSVIVKEKLSEPSSEAPELLTVMIKREKGFNPKSGDWEYAVFDGTGTKLESRGKLSNCQSCHVTFPHSDYVFRTYLTDDVRNKLK